VINSSSSSAAYTSDWENITGDSTGPHIQLNQFSTVDSENNWLFLAQKRDYGLNSFKSRGGNYVFINSGKQTCTAD
jgi:hypothetical protein